MDAVKSGLVNIIECKSFTDAQTLAGQEVANTAGFSVPVVVFQQGKRTESQRRPSISFRRQSVDEQIGAEEGNDCRDRGQDEST